MRTDFADLVRAELPEMFTTPEARELGWTMSAIKNEVRQGRIVRVRIGVYARAHDADLRTRILAAARAYPDAVVSHRCAALLRGHPLVGAPPPRPELTVAPRTNADLRGVHTYRARLREHDVIEMDGVRMTSHARTAIDVARHNHFAVAVVVLDAVLHDGAAPDELADVMGFCGDWFGSPRARTALRFADGRSESALESLSRITIARLGLPAPELQVQVFDRDGRFVGRSDFYWDRFGVIGEADGRAKYSLRDDGDAVAAFVAEKDRLAELEALHLVAARWGWAHATRETATLKQRIATAMAHGSARDAADLPRLWTPRYTPALCVPFLVRGRAA